MRLRAYDQTFLRHGLRLPFGCCKGRVRAIPGNIFVWRCVLWKPSIGVHTCHGVPVIDRPNFPALLVRLVVSLEGSGGLVV